MRFFMIFHFLRSLFSMALVFLKVIVTNPTAFVVNLILFAVCLIFTNMLRLTPGVALIMSFILILTILHFKVFDRFEMFLSATGKTSRVMLLVLHFVSCLALASFTARLFHASGQYGIVLFILTGVFMTVSFASFKNRLANYYGRGISINEWLALPAHSWYGEGE